MPKVTKKTTKNLKRTSTKRNDIILAVVLGVVVTAVGLFVTRYSNAGTNASFRRDPVTQMQGGKLVRRTSNTLARLASQTAPGVDSVFSLVTKEEMTNTATVCVEYTVLTRGTWVNIEYHSPTSGLANKGKQSNSLGNDVVCLERGSQAVDGTININVTPGSAYINKVYGVLRKADD